MMTVHKRTASVAFFLLAVAGSLATPARALASASRQEAPVAPAQNKVPSKALRPAASDLTTTDAALDKLLKPRVAAARKPAEKSSLARELAAMAREAGSDDAMR